MICPCLAIGRRAWLAGMAATLSLTAAGCARAASAAQREAAQALLSEHVSVDLHSHPGLYPRRYGNVLATHLERLARGRLRLLFATAVGDGPVLQVSATGAIKAVRQPVRGELYVAAYRQLRQFEDAIERGELVHVKTARDLAGLRGQGRPGALLAVEGGDFLEGRLDRVQEAFDRGVRSIQLTHYRVNELGDIQTEAPVHHGLSPFGKDVIREMNRLGMVVDVAHATFEGVKAAVEVATKPFILSHTMLFVRTPLRRAVTREHARLVARHGGVVGVFPVPVDGPSFDGFIDHVSRLIDAIGADHVGIGTDMDGIPAGGTFTDWGQWPSIPASLLARGYRRDEVAKVMGGNFVRVFEQVSGG